MNPKCFIIAEAGVNHNGSYELATKLVLAAKAAGADAVKFQTFKTESLVTKKSKKADYQLKTTIGADTQFEMLKSLEMSYDDQKKLFAFAQSKNIKIMSSAFDLESIDFLEGLGQDIYKIPSGEIVNFPYLQKIARLNKPVILSTGMCTLGEIESALNVLQESGLSKDLITVLHCNSEYPTPLADANLLAMKTIKQAFAVKVGYSDHTMGIEAAVAAVALGATVIEKHFTLSKTMDGPDHTASLEPQELETMVQYIRNVEIALGNGIKKPSASENKNKLAIRKSIVASRPIKKGEALTTENLTVKRPAGGISPMLWPELINTVAKHDFMTDDFIQI